MRLRIVSAAIVVSVVGATTLTHAQTPSQTRSHKRAAHVAAIKHESSRVIVTRRSYLDPGPEPLLGEQQRSTGYVFPLGLLNYHPGTKNPTDPTGSRFWPVNDPFWLHGP